MMLKPKQIIHSRLAHNILFQFILNGFSYLFPIALIPFLINTVGIEEYGLLNFALAFSFYFQVINEFGFDLSNVRHVVAARNQIDQLSKVVFGIIQCKLLICIVTATIYISIVVTIPEFRQNWVLYILAIIRVSAIALTPTWLFRSMEDVKYITKISIPVKVITIIPIFFCVKAEEDIYKVMFFYALECITTTIVSWTVIRKRYHLRYTHVSIRAVKSLFIDSFPFFTSTLLMRLYQNSNTVILKLVCGNAAAGIYTTAEKLYNAYASFASPLLSHILYPYFTRINNFKTINKVCLLVIIGNLFMVFFMYIVAPYFINRLITEKPTNIITIFNLFLIGILIDIPNNLVGFPYLGVMGYTNLVNRSTIFASIFYMIGVGVLLITENIFIESLVVLLISTQFFALLMRVWYIKSKKTHK